MATFQQRLRQLRKDKGLTIEQLAKELGTAKSTLSRYENGLREPKKDFLEILSSYFDVSYNFLLGITDVKHDNNENNIIDNEILEALDDIEIIKFLQENNLSDDIIKGLKGYILLDEESREIVNNLIKKMNPKKE
ncbi:helix-turn-helix domain-containing protein [Terrisporobacter hibernicus]|uniref:Helix-turn-helix transcriptional regulator n=1 Tax=Terrisporobacter hibernicus TaxID=2813371 RepID=A0AAX2ZDJ3_9FIRM|nr:helix-turn-helix transcriptional regulator [Terrisporobacter hibernicus]UEL47327.1 helix-turn-helix transcriptional regulator [Terrisporobacter hibernicus]